MRAVVFLVEALSHRLYFPQQLSSLNPADFPTRRLSLTLMLRVISAILRASHLPDHTSILLSESLYILDHLTSPLR